MKTQDTASVETNELRKRNGEIELVRFLAALLVVCTHAHYFSGCLVLCPEGSIAVEFFFVLSGYLLAASASKTAPLSSGGHAFLHYGTAVFLWHKIKAFWLELAIACSIGVVVYAGCHLHEPFSVARVCLDTLFGDVLMLKMTGFVPNGVNGAAWYLSALVFGCAMLYPLIKRFGVSPIYVVPGLLLLGGMYLTDGRDYGFASVTHWMGFTYKGNIRALAELLVGVSMYPLALRLSQLHCPQWGRVALTLFKWASWGGMVLYAAVPFYHRAGVVFVCIAAAIMLSFSKICCDNTWYQTRLLMWLGRLSLPLYLSHYYYAQNLEFLIPEGMAPALKLAVLFGCSLATALLVMAAAKHIRQRWAAGRTR